MAATKEDNIRIWEAVEKTDPKYTTKFKRKGGFSGTDISPTWRQKVMTQQFGPCGHGWGWTLEKTWSEYGCVFVQVNLWTIGEHGEKCFTGPNIGGTEIGRMADESYKMAITDAIGKCCASLGVAADIYCGQFDDSKYQRQVAEHFEEEAKAKEWTLTVSEISDLVEECEDFNALDKIIGRVRESAPPRKHLATLKAVFDHAKERLAETTECNGEKS